jgi:hypothetical protein
MRHGAIRVLILAAPAVAAISLLAPSGAEASRYVRKHHPQTKLGLNNSLRRSWAAEEVRPIVRPWSGGGDVCPGNARGIDCKSWPPPIIDDPDRRNGSGDGM